MRRNQIAGGQRVDGPRATGRRNQRTACKAHKVRIVLSKCRRRRYALKGRAARHRGVVAIVYRAALRVGCVRLVEDAVIGEVGAGLPDIVVIGGEIDEIVVGRIAVVQHAAGRRSKIGDRVVAGGEDKKVETVAAGQAVIPGAAVKRVRAGAAFERVGALHTLHKVVA